MGWPVLVLPPISCGSLVEWVHPQGLVRSAECSSYCRQLGKESCCFQRGGMVWRWWGIEWHRGELYCWSNGHRRGPGTLISGGTTFKDNVSMR